MKDTTMNSSGVNVSDSPTPSNIFDEFEEAYQVSEILYVDINDIWYYDDVSSKYFSYVKLYFDCFIRVVVFDNWYVSIV